MAFLSIQTFGFLSFDIQMNPKNISSLFTSLPYFGMKLSCVCLMFAYRTSLKSLRLRKLLD